VLVASTGVSLRLLGLVPEVETVLLVDGTAEPCAPMRAMCAELGVLYRHAGRELNYVESYNLGWRELTHDIVGLMANDIVPHPVNAIPQLLAWIARPDVGCVFPYLSSNRGEWDEAQRPGFLGRGRITCEPASMTLNLNLFKRDVLERIGGLDARYVVGYQEPILLIKIRKLGYRAVLVGDSRVMHYDALTKTLGATETTRALIRADAVRYAQEYPQYAAEDGIAGLRLSPWPFATTTRAAIAWWLAHHMPGRGLRRRTLEAVMRIEPFLCRYPARRGRAPVASSHAAPGG
jgi:GT2 family glycosyltransferase